MPYILGDESFFIIYDQAAYLTAKGSPAKLIAARIYTGPYVVTDANDQIMHEVRNPVYWDGTAPAVRGDRQVHHRCAVPHPRGRAR